MTEHDTLTSGDVTVVATPAVDAGEVVDETTDEATESGGSPEGAKATDPAAGATSTPSGRKAQLEREGEVAADFLETLLDICDLDVDIDGDRAIVSIVDSDEGRVPRRLVGQGGSTLDAFQELTRLAVQSATGERSRLMLDIAGHRAERKAALIELAKEAIAKVKDGSEREALSPMTAFERKVVHDEVLAAGLVSESEGAEPRRFVVVLPA